MIVKKIPVATWAEQRYDPPPSSWVIAQWRRRGEIHPAPEKVGHDWYVDPAAKRVQLGLVGRMQRVG